MIHASTGERLNELLQKALTKEVAIVIYTEELFHTNNDEGNRARVVKYSTQGLNLVGIGIQGAIKQGDRL